ncbi:hypothetical protein ACP275_03G020800 [Erythranthe tilingii]
MAAFVRQKSIPLFTKKPSSLCKSIFDFSISPRLYNSTTAPSRETQPVINSDLNKTEKSDIVISFFKEGGFSSTQLGKIVKYKPSLVSANLEKSIKPKIKIFQDLGFSGNDIADIASHNPSILFRSANNILIPSLSVLRGLLGSNEEVAKLLKKSGWFLVKDLEKTLLPNVDFLKSCCVTMEQIIRTVNSFPRFLLQNPENIRKCASKAEEMGVKRGSKMFIHAVRTVASMSDETWEMKLQAFRDLGFSEDDILRAFRKSAPAFAVSVEKMNKVKEVVVSSGKYDMACIISHPISFICSVEKRYKPRLQVLRILESKNLITKWPSFSTMYSISDEQFFDKFVGPYQHQVGHVLMPKCATRGKKTRLNES